ncbi:MAG: ATP-binding cassette domain-containing protein [Acholeplasmataceae bacterium]|jgi:putative ABC transport system permease protein
MIKLVNVSKYYKTDAGVSVGLVKANLEFSVGEFVAVVGESGSGKTTLLNVISGLDTYEDGEMYLFGEPTSHYEIEDLEKYRSTYVGFIFQNYNIVDSYTVMQNITIALELQGYPKDKIKSRALELIERVGLTHRKHHKAAKLSGGEKQRAVIARALAKDCPIIVADEPTGNLDSKSGAEVMALLHEISKDKLIIVVSHNYEEVKPYATRKVKIHDGQIVEDIKLKEVETTNEVKKPEIVEFSRTKTFKWSLMDLVSKPKRFIFLLIAQLTVMLLFSLSYAGGQMILRDTGGGFGFWVKPNYYTENRINVQRFDGQPISLAEIESFKSMDKVVSVSENNIQFFDTANWMELESTDNFYRTEKVQGTSHNTIFRGGNAAEISKGSPATKVNEVILSNNFITTFDVDEEVLIRIQDRRSGNFMTETVTIKGFSKDNKGIVYFHEDFGKPNQLGFRFSAAEFGRQLKIYWNGRLKIYEVLVVEDVSEPAVDFILNDYELEGLESIEIKDANQTYYSAPIAEVNYKTGSQFYEMVMTYKKLEEITKGAYNTPYEIALIVKDKMDADLVISNLDNKIYQIRTLSKTDDPADKLLKDIISVVLFVGSLLNLLFLYAILGLVIRNSMNARKKDFAIFRSIGTNEKTIGLLVILQQILISVFAYIILVIVINVLAIVMPQSFIDFRLLHWYHYLTLFILFMLFSIWLGFRFNRKIFKITVIKNLQIEEVV